MLRSVTFVGATMQGSAFAGLARSPKAKLLWVLGAFTVLAVILNGLDAGLNVLVAIGVAVVLDLGLVYTRTSRVELPDGAVITGLIVALVLRIEEPLIVIAATSVLAITSKHLFRSRWSNVFNPAAFGLVASALWLDSGQSWWGALPDAGWLGACLLVAACLYFSDHLNKLVALMAFGCAYLGLFGLASIATDSVAEIFRAPDVHMLLFFSAFMLTDPPTSPVRYLHQAIFGGIVALAAVLTFIGVGGVYFLPAGLLVGNAAESLRRVAGRRAELPRATAMAVEKNSVEI